MAEQDIFEREIILDELKRTFEISKTDENQFRARAKDIHDVQRKFLKLQTKIEKTLLSSQNFDREEQLRFRNEFNDVYYAILSRVDAIKKVDEECRRMSRASLYPQPSHTHCELKKLPTLPLPSFSGDATNWTSYYDLYISIVHNNDGYTDAEKFRYLLLTLKDEPFNLIKSIPITDDNYRIALDILVSRYENKRAIASKHLDCIVEIEPYSEKNNRGLRNLLNIYQENIKALEAMRFPTKQWSFVLLHILLRKIPHSIRQRFELSLPNPSEIPDVELLIEFLNRELIACELLLSTDNRNYHQNFTRTRNYNFYSDRTSNPVPRLNRSLTVNAATPASSYNTHSYNNTNEFRTYNKDNIDKSCVCCGGQHSLTKCTEFLSRSPNDRHSLIKNKDVCFNCLGRGHNVANCKSSFTCSKCTTPKRHHTLIHFPTANFAVRQATSPIHQVDKNVSFSCPAENAAAPAHHVMSSSASQATPIDCYATNARSVSTSTVLLSTALVDVYVGEQKRSSVRAIVDTGSMASFITQACAQRLGLKRNFANVPIYGIGDNKPVHPKGVVSCSIAPRNSSQPIIPVNCLVLSKLIPQMPSVKLPYKEWPHINNLKLADPFFHTPQPVEMLLGADILSHILLSDVITGPPGTPIAMSSVFGYLLLGKLAFNSPTPPPVQACFSSLFDDGNLKKFWELESVPEVQVLSPEERLCESIFVSTQFRDASGRYSVALPRKPDAKPLGDTKEIALARLFKLEQRLERNPSHKIEYHTCLNEYVELNHMEPVYDGSGSLESSDVCYIPHHMVFKHSSESSKCRVVFDANSPSSNGTSLNDILLTGPKLHQDIVDILLKFRVHRVALTADIKQMYRNILVHEKDRDLQRILWRASRDEPVSEFRLRVVTFGVNSSPYLALRVIKQLAYDEQSTFPLASKVLLDQVFVDDVVTGASDEAQALALQQELIGICNSAGFELRKWHSTSPAILAAVQPQELHGERRQVAFAPMENDNQTKVLGLRWNPQSDKFSFSVECSVDDANITKRTILSQIAKIYDPMGWLSPITMFAKHLMQLLWIARVQWDERPPIDIVNAWTAFNNELPLLSRIELPRYIFPTSGSVSIHGFADASDVGYSGTVYVRFKDESGNIHTFLLLAKTRVAPLSPCLTIPRLELMAAVMVSKLIEKVLNTYRDRVHIEEVFAWSDSSIVLAWLRSPPYEWKTFVSNRISEILTRIPNCVWRHVPSSSNPADGPSRGMLPSALIQNNLWFHGPPWLREEPTAWPLHNAVPSTKEERRDVSVASAPVTLADDIEIVDRFSNLNKLVRVTSLIFRFYSIIKSRLNNNKEKCVSYPKHITVHEFNFSLKRLIYLVQHQVFGEDIKCILQGKSPSNQLRRLNPFVDDDNFLRVGGRLHKSLLPYESKHQLILPKRHKFTSLIIDDAHLTHLHAGTQSVQYLLLQKYWILSSRDVIRKQIFQCVKCFRARPARTQVQMAPLPPARVQPERPFIKTAVDFAGPFYVKSNKARNAKITKCYVAVFVCMSTKAVHLEPVTQLSTSCFLECLRRFVSRRGLVKEIYSDCGRNFVGCNNYLKDLYEFLRKDSIQCILNSHTLNQGIVWHFQPPYAPHFGGLFESAVKSFKHCFYRVVGTQTLTYEEMHTLLCQIEAVLNSRPLCVLSSDANDPLPLTPAHFLIGGPLTAIPDVPLIDENPGRLVRWQWTQQCVQHFWKRWSREYLHEMQQLSKWYRDRGSPIGVGDIVVVMEDNLPPLQWQLARVHTLHPGADGAVRVVTLQVGKRLFKRAVVKLCKLPIE